MKGEWVRECEGHTAVIFVHGILSSGEKCWLNPNGKYWPQLVKDEKSFEDVGIWVFTYRTDAFSASYTLNDVTDSLKEFMRLDKVIDRQNLIFVCHSMGGIVVRRYIVQQHVGLIDRHSNVGLFLVASPSLGADYANFLRALAKSLGNSQVEALCTGQSNTWLSALDTDFMNIKDTGRIQIRGKELEDNFFAGRFLFFFPRVVPPYSGAPSSAELLKEKAAKLSIEEKQKFQDAIRAVQKALYETRRYMKRTSRGEFRNPDTEEQLSLLRDKAASRIIPFDPELPSLCYVKAHGWADEKIWDDPQFKDLPLKLDDMLAKVLQLGH